jgi:hypothetical protein
MAYPSGTVYPGANTFPGGGTGPPYPPPSNTGQLEWNRIEDRQIEAGLDRGVLYPKNSMAVSWSGLTSIEEEGGEGAAEYYVDGRPFLYFPKPKEFKAKMNAYMYPDAFSSIIGEVEVADGMYLDSQVGDSFGLSYRTKIVDSIKGDNAGYKIHLIYNATVVPSSKNYGTIGNNINPVEFSWGIQAVPVKVDGYRPTAHITIDTRHMDIARIGELEALIYGTEEELPMMPDAQAIFDLLSFGNAIIITDNGDETWTAEGSYRNIYMIGDEIFEIDNINAVIHGNGTYTISSTGEDPDGGHGHIYGSATLSSQSSLTATAGVSHLGNAIADLSAQASLSAVGNVVTYYRSSLSYRSNTTYRA